MTTKSLFTPTGELSLMTALSISTANRSVADAAQYAPLLMLRAQNYSPTIRASHCVDHALPLFAISDVLATDPAHRKTAARGYALTFSLLQYQAGHERTAKQAANKWSEIVKTLPEADRAQEIEHIQKTLGGAAATQLPKMLPPASPAPA